MSYSEDQIKKYLEILHNYTKNISDESKMQSSPAGGFLGGATPPSKCLNCENRTFWTIDFGYKICEECGITNGHVLGYFDPKEYDRLYFRKKSVYQRKYYYEKKIKQIPNLSGEDKSLLYKKLMEIDEKVLKEVNKKFSRKRMINIFYIIERMLDEMGLNHKIQLNISSQTKEYYDRWWESYLKLRSHEREGC